MSFSQQYLAETRHLLRQIDPDVLDTLAAHLATVRDRGGRLFFLGVGGSAANASHAVNDFRKMAGIESYTPTDNVAELTAHTNDHGWGTSFVAWLIESKLNDTDAIIVLSVGGGNAGTSQNIVSALAHAHQVGAMILGIVGRHGGATLKVADLCVLVPTVNPSTITPHAEEMQSILLHLLVSHPALARS